MFTTPNKLRACDSLVRSLNLIKQFCEKTPFLGNAEMTDLFKCRKPGTQCCAPKSQINVHGTKNNSIQADHVTEETPSHNAETSSFPAHRNPTLQTETSK